MIKEQIEKILDREVTIIHPKSLDNGDYTLIADEKISEEDFEKLQKNKPEFISRIEFVKPRFINLYLSKEFFKNSLEEIINKGENFGRGEHNNRFKVLVEYTSPNLFKPLHIGNLVGNITGEALSRIFEFSGADVKRINYPSDIGLTVAKAVWGLKKTQNDPNDIKALGEAYRIGNDAYENREADKVEIEEINKALYEDSNPDWSYLRKKGIETSLKHLDSICERLGTKFDKEFFESESAPVGQQLVKENLGKVFEKSDGAIVFHGDHTRVFLNSQGLPTYEAKELGLFKLKSEEFPSFDMSITITGTEQKDFFRVVFEAIKKVFPEKTQGRDLRHIGNSFLRLPSGKMSSRKGNTISGEDLIEEVKIKVKDDEKVAIGAIKYMILRQAIGNDIVFDIEKSVSTEGDSGVYLQYAHARSNSIIEKSMNINTKSGQHSVLAKSDREIHEVERLLYRFPEVVERAGKEYAPHYITTYLTELASSFNNFYAHEQIISDDPESSYRIAITKAFNIVMKNGLEILGIPAPEKM